ncbi:hypothetical protein SAMN06297229_1557 [Pseudidiomarina planktonica]|uniref:Outer membrane protein beta-barrel domain-containing protein n=1 Tax=Pseudidiomarina planktonica TaxID=1323738 RepID=A0A1Y6EUZ0_9GAMM|nr:hypothetical protein [Pseudidiomarina planktonica]RUO65086.1 hypothetical protein CWI77_00990 [Pseudidiomarina planktonica]SMQ66538.1 hypothetical protein SAMN06297229_1557 [Pseudidiomarina planktonica]
MYKNKFRLSGSAAAILALSTTAFSGTVLAEQQPDFNYIGVAAENNNEYSGSDTGLRFEASYELQDRYFLSGYYRTLGNNGFSNDDFNSFAVKGGRYFGLADGLTADFSVKAGNVDYDVDDSNFYGIEANLRQRIGMFEVHGGLGWVDYTDGGTDTQYIVGGRAFITPALAIGVDFNDSEFGEGWLLTARYHW